MIIINFYFNGRAYHIERYGRQVIVDTLQGTYGRMPGLRTDSYRLPR